MKKSSYLVILPFFALLFAVLLAYWLVPDEQRSTTENRALQQTPVWDLTDLDALTDNWADYFSDQFPWRERLLKLYSRLELAQGKVNVRNAYVLSDGWLTTYIYRSTDSEREPYIRAIAEAVQENPDVDFVYAAVPQKTDLLPELAAPYLSGENSAANRADLLSALTTVDGLTAVDVGGYLLDSLTLEQREALFFKTDYHWNANGAYAAASYVCQSMVEAGLISERCLPDAGDFSWSDLTGTPYLGDLNRHFSYLFSMQETVSLYTVSDVSGLSYFFSTDDSEPAQRSEIVSSGLGEDTLTYNSLFTKNWGYYRVENAIALSDRHVLILKDSFQCATTDYFSRVFAEVDVVDPRYYTEAESFSQLLEARDIDTVLFFYHQNNLSTELVTFLTEAQ